MKTGQQLGTVLMMETGQLLCLNTVLERHPGKLY